MSKALETAVAGLVGILAFSVGLVCLYFLWQGWKAVWPDRFFQITTRYCLEDKRIIKADPIFEDDGKHEDEAYRVSYEDGTVGLVDQARLQTGKVCTKTVDYYSNEPAAQGLTKYGDY